MKSPAEDNLDTENLLASPIGKEESLLRAHARQIPGGGKEDELVKAGQILCGIGEEGLLKLFTALFYATSSFLIMVVNKQVLTVHGFPSFQVTIQLVTKLKYKSLLRPLKIGKTSQIGFHL